MEFNDSDVEGIIPVKKNKNTELRNCRELSKNTG